MKNIRRTLAALLVIAMLILPLAACKDNGNEGPQTSGNVAVTTAPQTSVETEGYDPEGRKYDGYTYRILRYDSEKQGGWVGRPNDIFNEDHTAGILEEAVYRRNKLVEEQLGVTIELFTSHKTFVDDVGKSAADPSAAYDLLLPRLNDVAKLLTNDYIRDWKELELDTTYSWWDKNSIDTFTMAGRVFAMSSDLTFVDKLSSLAVIVNQANAEKLQLQSLIPLVQKHEWTVDKMLEFANYATTEISGVKGLYTQNDNSYYFLHSAGIETVTIEDDKLVCNLNNDRAITVLQKAYAALNAEYCRNRQYDNGKTTSTSDFVQGFVQQEGGGLFMLRSVESFYEIVKHTTDYVVLPMPIYDDNVKEYCSSVNGYTAVALCLPKTCSRDTDDRTTDVIQLLSMYSNREVMPKLYNVVLGTRFAGSADNSEMLRLIFSNRLYDRGLYWSAGIRNTVIITKGAIANAESTVASTITKNLNSINGALANIYDKALTYSFDK